MEALEKYYQEYLWGYPNDVNWLDYDIEMQLTKDRIERILKVGYLSEDDIEFIYSLLPDILSLVCLMLLDHSNILCISNSIFN